MNEAKNKKIDVVIAQLAEKGGLDKVLNEVLPYLQECGYQIRLIQLVDCGINWIKDGIENYSIRDMENAGTFRDAAMEYAGFLEQNGKADVILAAGWPVVVTIVRLALSSLGIEDVIVAAWPHMQLQEGELHGVGGAVCMADADVVLAISREIEQETLALFPHHQVLRIKNPIDLKYESYDVKRDRKILAFVGRLVDYKNIELIFQAMSKSKEKYSLLVAGDGEMEKTKKLCSQYHLEKDVEFLGWVEKPWEKLKHAGWLIVSSDYEGFSLVIVEALAQGIPVISTPVGIAPEVIKPGKNGYLYPIKDSDNLALILDAISEGVLKQPDSKDCQKSAAPYGKEAVLCEFTEQLNKICSGRIRI